jgi:hypothetical protein
MLIIYLGITFPDAMGNNTKSPLLAVEGELHSVAFLGLIQFGSFFFLDCGSMLVMALAHAQKSGERQFINRHVCVSHYILTVHEVNSFAVPLVKEMGGLFGLGYLTAERIVRIYLLSILITFSSYL